MPDRAPTTRMTNEARERHSHRDPPGSKLHDGCPPQRAFMSSRKNTVYCVAQSLRTPLTRSHNGQQYRHHLPTTITNPSVRVQLVYATAREPQTLNPKT